MSAIVKLTTTDTTDTALLRDRISLLVREFAETAFKKKPFVPGSTPIPSSGRVIGELEVQYMVAASLDGWLTSGRFNDEFEARLAEFLGLRNLITVNSGSSANLVAFNTLTSAALGDRAIRRGDEVITVAAGFPTTVNPIIQFGAIPVFVDITLKDSMYNINVEKIEEAISPKTKAIMLAHTLGNPFEVERVREICDQYNLWLVEDCCDALGSLYNGKLVGTYGDLGTLSFYPAHHITMGEGGAVFTNSIELRKISTSIRDWGRDCYCPGGRDNTCGSRFCQKFGTLPLGYDHKYVYSNIGFNLKITDMQAACGLAQLASLPEFIERRRQNFQYLRDRLLSCEEFLILPDATKNTNPSWFGFPITVRKDSPVSAQDLSAFLEQNKIGTRKLFAGNLTRQPYMADRQYRISGGLEVTDYVMQSTFWIGIYPGINFEMLDFVTAKIEEFFGLRFNDC
jgi:CDP-6-deoxy-D-xylo-4-hexulose-3-dehydrase